MEKLLVFTKKIKITRKDIEKCKDILWDACQEGNLSKLQDLLNKEKN